MSVILSSLEAYTGEQRPVSPLKPPTPFVPDYYHDKRSLQHRGAQHIRCDLSAAADLWICGCTGSRFAMGTAMLQAVRRRMKRLTLKREPVHPTLNEHLWALVLQHLDTLQDRFKASTSCRAAWKAGLLKLEIPVHLPIKGMSQTILHPDRPVCLCTRT